MYIYFYFSRSNNGYNASTQKNVWNIPCENKITLSHTYVLQWLKGVCTYMMLTSDPGAKEKPSKIADIPGQSVASPYRCLVYYVTSGDDSCRDRIWLVSCGSNIPKVRKMLAKKTWFCFAIFSSSALCRVSLQRRR